MGRRKRSSEEERRRVLTAFRRSGLSLKSFAERSGVPYSTLFLWRKREASSVPGQLVPVEIRDGSVPALEVRVGAAAVRVEAGFDEGHLVRVVRALGAC